MVLLTERPDQEPGRSSTNEAQEGPKTRLCWSPEDTWRRRPGGAGGAHDGLELSDGQRVDVTATQQHRRGVRLQHFLLNTEPGTPEEPFCQDQPGLERLLQGDVTSGNAEASP